MKQIPASPKTPCFSFGYDSMLGTKLINEQVLTERFKFAN